MLLHYHSALIVPLHLTPHSLPNKDPTNEPMKDFINTLLILKDVTKPSYI